MNTEHPILFSTEMVRAILDGRKTQTRRPVKPQPPIGINALWFGQNSPRKPETSQPTGSFVYCGRDYVCPFGRIGDTLWVRETWAISDDIDGRELVAYRAGGTRLIAPGPTVTHGEHRCVRFVTRWTPSIHMPHWACRLFLRITDIRVERVRDISEEDAKAEGVDAVPGKGIHGWMPHALEFCLAWDSIYKKQKHGWDTNPWVWAITFEVIK